ncbi:hypothetical protein SASC598O02_008470 [Snodgrassella alvi SCGC AB-598-O02]|nr:hypothetical protein SASC598O02_008470 [Snodgrassella alvi SCGC AB-598-O02]
MGDYEEVRNYLKFEVIYSFYYEKLMYKFLGRMDKLASFILLLTGMSVIATTWNEVFLGSIVAIVTTLQLVYSPGSKSQSAKGVYQKYYSMYIHFDEMDNEVIKNKLLNLSENETDEIGFLSHPARLAALAMLGWTLEYGYSEEPRKLTKLEYFAALFAGELPEYRFTTK